MKKTLLAFLFSVLAWSSTCEAINIRFTNNEVNLGTATQIPMTNEYAGFGMLFQNVFRYIDSRDPFSDAPNQVNGLNLGISTGLSQGNIGRVDFATPTSASGITFDWLTLASNQFHIEAFNSSGVQIGSFVSPVGVDLVGTNSLPGAIKYFTFHNNQASVGIANLTFNLVPEPTALLLTTIGVGASLRFRSQRV